MSDARSIIQGIQVSEKGTALSESQNKYFLRVAPSANKIEIKRAVEELFKVHVAKVNTLNYLGKLKRTRTARPGKRSDWKRAVVTLKEGHKIDLTQ